MTRNLTIWIAFIAIALASTWYALTYFPKVFSFVSVDIKIDRNQAIDNARALAEKHGWGFAGETRDAASFSVDSTAQTYLELEAGGADVFAEVVELPAWSPYLWTVRLFQESETAEARIQFRPDGRPFGFAERVPEDEERPNISPAQAQSLGENAAIDLWQIDIRSYELIESAQHTRPNGRVDHDFTYEKDDPLLAEARLQVHVTISGDAVSQVQPAVKVPEAFERRYDEMRSANTSIGLGGTVGIVIYVLLGCGFGCYYLLKRNALQWRAGTFFGVLIGALMAGYYINALPLAWMSYDTSLSAGNYLLLQIGQGVGIGVLLGGVMAVTFIAAEGLSRLAFPHHPQLWRVWSPQSGASPTVAGQTITGYLMAPIMLAMLVTFYGVTGDLWGWWNPSDTLVSPDNLAHYAPWLSPFALSFHAGFWEECLMRAIPLAGAALIGERYGQRNLFIAIAFVAQAIVFGAAHAAYPAQPAYARLVELILPSFIFGALYLRFGLLPAVIMHYVYDIVLMSIPVFATPGDGVMIDRTLLLILALLPVLIVVYRRVQQGQILATGLPAKLPHARRELGRR
ncbi:MAG: CPBP family intramembrane glutamic endopeptidase, partial [Pseudomonadota bacterium]